MDFRVKKQPATRPSELSQKLVSKVSKVRKVRKVRKVCHPMSPGEDVMPSHPEKKVSVLCENEGTERRDKREEEEEEKEEEECRSGSISRIQQMM